MSKKWYIVHVYSGFENRVCDNLKERVKTHNLSEQFGEIIVPTEKVVEIVKGQRRETLRKFYPGYILVEMKMNNKTWHLVKTTSKVTGFIGGTSNNPTPITEKEIERIMMQVAEGSKQPKPKFNFCDGDEIRVIDGPFNNFSGVVEEVFHEKGKLRVLISIFGRATPVELEFIQLTKV